VERKVSTTVLVRGPRSAIGTVRALPPARARARRSPMADEDAPPTSALRSAWVDDPESRAEVEGEFATLAAVLERVSEG
jgi:hypothetical protein